MSRPIATVLGPSDVLVLRALGLGDALTAVPALRGIRRAWPHRRVVLAAPEHVGEWLTGFGMIDAVLATVGLQPLPEVGPGGHLAVNLHGRGPTSHHIVAATEPAQIVAFANATAGHPARPGDIGPQWFAEEHEVHRWCRLIGAAGGDCGAEDLRLDAHRSAIGEHPFGDLPGLWSGPGDPARPVLLHPGAASAARRWPVQRWAMIVQHLTSAGYKVVVTGAAEEASLCGQVAANAPGARSVAGKLDLHALTALVAGARLLICGDTGVAHLATALGTSSVVLFGPTSPEGWGPLIDPHMHTVLWHGDGSGDPHAERIDPALEAITVPEVLEAATTLLT